MPPNHDHFNLETLALQRTAIIDRRYAMIEGLSLVQNMVLAVAAGYFLGALPFAHIASRIRGIDVFATGSTLAGTANVFFNVGHRTGALVLVGDLGDQAVAETARLLKPGGRFGLSDVTIEPGALPAELEGDLGQVLCMTSALTADGYVDLLEEGGFTVTERLDASGEIVKILDEVEGKLAAFLAFQRMSGAATGESQLERSPELVAKVRDMVNAGELGYCLFVGEKRG